jgi:hypothetical protein
LDAQLRETHAPYSAPKAIDQAQKSNTAARARESFRGGRRDGVQSFARARRLYAEVFADNPKT